MTSNSVTQLTMEQIEQANKQQLVTWLNQAIEELNKRREQKSNKKFLVLEILKKSAPISILDISNELEISTKNVSSLLTYLRKDGITIHTDDKGRKYLV